MKITRTILVCLLCFTFGHHETSVAQPQIVTSLLNACGYVCSIAAASMGYPNSGFLGYQEPSALEAFIERLLDEADAIVFNNKILLADIPKQLHALYIKFMKEGLIDDLPVSDSAISRSADLRVQYKTWGLVADAVRETIESTEWTRKKDPNFVENIVWGEEGQLVWPYLGVQSQSVRFFAYLHSSNTFNSQLGNCVSQNLEKSLSLSFKFEIENKLRWRIRDTLQKFQEWARISRQEPEDVALYPASYYIFTVYQLASFAFLRTIEVRSISETISQNLQEVTSEDEAEKFLSEFKEALSKTEIKYRSDAIWGRLRETELSLLKRNFK